MSKKPLRTRAEMQSTRSLVLNGEIIMYGIIDAMSDPFDDAATIRAIDVMGSLAELSAEETIVVRINSPGGSVVEGLAIYNALRAWGKPIEVHVDAMAASAASVVAMAGDEIVMAENATIMIHDPWAFAMGGSDDFRAAADEIDRQKAILVNIYAQRTKLDPSEIEAMMAAETYLSAADAVAKGFADRVDQPLKVAACALLDPARLAQFLSPVRTRAEKARDPAAAAAQHKERLMSQKPGAAEIQAAKNDAVRAERERRTEIKAAIKKAGIDNAAAEEMIEAGLTMTEAQAKIDEIVAKKRTDSAVDADAVRNAATAAERERVHGISAAVRAAKLDVSVADDLIRDGISLEIARTRIMEAWAKKQEAAEGNDAPGRRTRVDDGGDEIDRWVVGAREGLLARANLKGGKRNEFSGLTLAELARSALSIRNIKSGSMDRMTMVGQAFTVRAEGPGYHSTSDFGNIIQNVAYRAMMVGYEEADENFPKWTGKGTASDFRAIARVDLGLYPALDKVEEGAEYKYGTIADTGTTVQIATYGKMFAITRQAIINDDLQFFDRVPRKMGRAAKRTIGNLVYAILNGNPTMQDSVALFNSAHGNLAGTSAPPSVTSVSAARAAMARQKDEAGIGTAVGIRPKYALVPPELLDTFNVLMNSERTPGDAGQIPNPVRGLVETIDDSRLSGTAWYLAGDPQQVDTIEVTYLDGNEDPFMDQRDGWTVDGTEMKVRLDAGVKALHWRGLFKNAGA